MTKAADILEAKRRERVAAEPWQTQEHMDRNGEVANAARSAGETEYAAEISGLARAARDHPNKRRPE